MFVFDITDEAMKWHKSYGHVKFASFKQLINRKMASGISCNIAFDMRCNVCFKFKCIATFSAVQSKFVYFIRN